MGVWERSIVAARTEPRRPRASGGEFTVGGGFGEVALAEFQARVQGVGVGGEGDLGGAADSQRVVGEREGGAGDGGGGASGDGDAVAADVAGDGAEVAREGNVEAR